MIQLVVFYDEQFWLAVFEKIESDSMQVLKKIYPTEPKESDLYDFILNQWQGMCFSEEMSIKQKENKTLSYKKQQQKVKKELDNNGISTKSQMAIQLQREQNKKQKRQLSQFEKEQQKRIKFNLKQAKKKEKKKGH